MSTWDPPLYTLCKYEALVCTSPPLCRCGECVIKKHQSQPDECFFAINSLVITHRARIIYRLKLTRRWSTKKSADVYSSSGNVRRLGATTVCSDDPPLCPPSVTDVTPRESIEGSRAIGVKRFPIMSCLTVKPDLAPSNTTRERFIYNNMQSKQLFDDDPTQQKKTSLLLYVSKWIITHKESCRYTSMHACELHANPERVIRRLYNSAALPHV